MIKNSDSVDFRNGLTSGILLSAVILVEGYNTGAAEQLIEETGLSWPDLDTVNMEANDKKVLSGIKEFFKKEVAET
jgi:hypothetical protein